MKRDSALDALRGLAIIGMVLSGMIQHNAAVPAWMYHAQVGPRSGFAFDASWVGITWVDLIFPMFLFAMGGAMSYSLGRQRSSGVPTRSIVGKLVARTLKLFLFALAVRQLHPYSLNAGAWGWAYALLAFGAMTLAFVDFERLNRSRKTSAWLNAGGMMLLAVMLLSRGALFGKPFSLANSDIIILVLANVSLVGGVIYWFTAGKTNARWAVVALVAAMFMTCGEAGSWNARVWDFSLWRLLPESWLSVLGEVGLNGSPVLINVAFWKYLVIVLIGSIIGDNMVTMSEEGRELPTAVVWRTGLCAAAIVVANTTFLYMREIWINLLVNGVLTALLAVSLKNMDARLSAIVRVALVVLWLGLVLEAQQGGIRKDFSTIGYLVLTSSLSAFIALTFSMLMRLGVACGNIAKIGRNPLVGYVAGGYVVLPLLALTGLLPLIDGWHTELWPGFAVIRGCVVTLGMALVVIFFVNRKILFKI